jgi:hypothetical protein
MAAMAASKQIRAVGSVLIIIVGLLNFHIPHFILESTTQFNSHTYSLELILLANLAGAVLAALAICRNLHWGWLLGIAIVAISLALCTLLRKRSAYRDSLRCGWSPVGFSRYWSKSSLQLSP